MTYRQIVNRGDPDALVIGAGVSGLTTAVCLAETGLRVNVWAADPPASTTSVAAGAMWGPYLAEPLDRVRRWSHQTLAELRQLATNPNTGVRLVHGIEVSRAIAAPPDWAEQLDGFKICEPRELPDGFATGWRFTAPIIDMPTYLGYLHQRFTAAGGTMHLRRLRSFDEAINAASVLVNCTGLGARELVPDPELTPIRGQLVVVSNPGITEFFTEDTGLSPDLVHIYPQGNTAVLGGQAAPGQASLEPDPDVAAAILLRCRAVEPRLFHARIIGHRVGLRPARPMIRLDAQHVAGTRLIHNYGHGGAGVTLSWGCAREISSMIATNV